jgi:hypothetical protein
MAYGIWHMAYGIEGVGYMAYGIEGVGLIPESLLSR